MTDWPTIALGGFCSGIGALTNELIHRRSARRRKPAAPVMHVPGIGTPPAPATTPWIATAIDDVRRQVAQRQIDSDVLKSHGIAPGVYTGMDHRPCRCTACRAERPTPW